MYYLMALQPWFFAMRYLESSTMMQSQNCILKVLIGLLRWTVVAVYCAILAWILINLLRDRYFYTYFYLIYGRVAGEMIQVKTWYSLQILSTVFTVFAICKFVFVTKKLDSGEKNTKMMWLHIALLLLQNACATIYFLQVVINPYYLGFSKASISTQPYLSLVVADLLIQILIIYIVLKMGASA
jgi:hypothetical protein